MGPDFRLIMAYYQNVIIPSAYDGAGSDPTQYGFPFLDAQLKNWAALCSTHVTLISGYDQSTIQENTSNTSRRRFDIQFKSDAEVAGTDTGTAMGFSIATDSWLYRYAWIGHTPGTGENGAGSTQYEKYQYSTSINRGTSSNWNSGSSFAVMYSDTPGQRFFTYSEFIGGTTVSSDRQQIAFIELSGTSGNDPNMGMQWIMIHRDGSHLLTRYEHDDPPSPFRPWNSTASYISPIRTYNSEGLILKNVPIHTDSGLYAGYIPEDTMLWSRYDLAHNSEIKYNNKYYKALNGRFLMRTG